MEVGCFKSAWLILTIGVWILLCTAAYGQQARRTSEVPDKSHLDQQAASRLRPQLMAQSTAASGRYATGRAVFDGLSQQIPAPSGSKVAWQLRIVDDDQLNAYSSPDGTVYVESGLAKLAGASAGIWAAILSHEIAHVTRRDWARRDLYQKYLENRGSTGIVLGAPSPPGASWQDSEKASEDLGRFGRQMELEADREGLMLMARAGYHPDFVPALHHLLHAHGLGSNRASLYSMHPCWEERDRELSHAYVTASIEFARLWPEWYDSPGGNPPVVVFADEPTVKRTSASEWEIKIPMRCQNLAGTVEVVLGAGSRQGDKTGRKQLPGPIEPESETRQLTGCTSPRTTITFTLADLSSPQNNGAQWTDVYVLDSWGGVLARTDLPKLPR